MAVPTGFEPAFSALTGPRVWPGYTTGPTAEKFSNNAVLCPGALGSGVGGPETPIATLAPQWHRCQEW